MGFHLIARVYRRTTGSCLLLLVLSIILKYVQSKDLLVSSRSRNIQKQLNFVQRCHHCVFHYATESYEQCRHPTPYGGTRGYEDCRGKCYVRIDPNGYVYRGCANATIFPNINLFHPDECSNQGQPIALWWFCKSPLCNDIDLLEQCKDPNYPEQRFFNICDGHCRDPTGSYADPHNSTYRIQCGYGSIGGRPCDCCKQYHLKCPRSTVWDDKRKQCIPGRRTPPIIGRGYKYGFQ